MPEQAGQIQYIVEADTSSLLTGEKTADKFVKSVSGGMRKAESNVVSFNSKLSKTPVQMTKTASAVKSSTSNMDQFGRKAGMAGIQVQQLVGQIQGGQNVFNALSAQSADLGFVLGFPLLGAVTGIAAAFAGPLISAFTGVESESSKLTSDMETLNNVIKTNEQGVNALSSEYANLAKVSASLAKAQLAIAVIEANEALKNSQKLVMDTAESMQTWTSSVDDATDALGYLERKGLSGYELLREIESLKFAGPTSSFYDLNKVLDETESKFGASKLQAIELLSAIKAVKINPSKDAFDRLATITATLAKQSGYTNKEFNEFAKTVAQAAREGVAGANAIKALDDVMSGTLTTTSSATDRFADLKNELEFEKTTVGKTAEQVAILNAQHRLGADATKAQKDAIALLVSELYSMQDAINRRGTGPSPIFDFTRGMPSKSEIASKLKSYETLIKTSEENAAKIRDEKRGDIELLYAKGKITEQEYYNARRAIATEYYNSLNNKEAENAMKYEEYQAKKRELDAQYSRQYLESHSTMSKVALDATNALASGATSAITGMLSGTESVEDAMRGLAQTIINSVLQSLIQTAVQYTVLPALAQAFGIAQAEASTVAATASVAASQTTAASTSAAAAEVAAASAPAAAATATWSFGSAALIGAAALGSIFLLSKTLSGNRRYGGSVSSGNMYQVNESGIPEVYSYGNSDYLMASSNAKVTPLDKFGGDSGVNISINNYASDSVSVSAQKTETGYDIDIVTKQVAANLSSQINKRQGSFYQSVKGAR